MGQLSKIVETPKPHDNVSCMMAYMTKMGWPGAGLRAGLLLPVMPSPSRPPAVAMASRLLLKMLLVYEHRV